MTDQSGIILYSLTDSVSVSMTCPSCGSDDWKLASVVYQQGLSHAVLSSSGNTLGIGAGSGGVGVGYAKSNSTTQGVNQSEFSRRAARPEYPQKPSPPRPISKKKQSKEQFEKGSVFAKWLVAILAAFLLYRLNRWLSAAAALLILLFMDAIKDFLNKPESYDEYEANWEQSIKNHEESLIAYERAVERYNQELADYLAWDTKRICQRCGFGYH